MDDGSSNDSYWITPFYVGRYFQHRKIRRNKKHEDVKVIAIIWMAVGVLIY